jgi:2-methylcitrate dehydratase PrpD
MPHAVAATLVKGTGGAEASLYDTLADDAIGALREKVEMTSFSPLPPPPDDRPARVRVTLHDGRELVRQCLSAQGGPDRPFPPEVLIDKVTALTAPVYPRMAAILSELMTPARTRAPRGWDDIVGELCAGPAA